MNVSPQVKAEADAFDAQFGTQSLVLASNKGVHVAETFLNNMKHMEQSWARERRAAGDDPEKNWRLLIIDGAGCHDGFLEVLACLRSKKVLVVKMPSKVSDKLQVLDVTVFKGTKVYFKDLIKSLLVHGHMVASRNVMTGLMLGALLMSATERVIKNGFAACGLIPFDPEWVAKHEDDFLIADMFATKNIVVPGHIEEPTERFNFIKMNCLQSSDVSSLVAALDLQVPGSQLQATSQRLHANSLVVSSRRSKVTDKAQSARSKAIDVAHHLG